MDRNDIAYWFPILEATGIPVPATEILRTDVDLSLLLDGIQPEGRIAFLTDLRAACDRRGYPCFLRTGHTSNKHDWRESCYVTDPERLPLHVFNLVEFSACADFLGLPTQTWAVREFLDLESYFTAFNGMPVAREFRCFFRDHAILCMHPYWPSDAITNPSQQDYQPYLENLSQLGSQTTHAIRKLLAPVVAAFDRGWSVDVCRARNGIWYVTDMAEMDRSFHWPTCPHGQREGR